MRRPTAFSTFRAAFAGALVLAAAVSCDTYTTSTMETPTDGAIRVRVHPVQVRLTAAQKDSIIARSLADSSVVPVGPVANVIGAPTSAAASVAACGGAGSFAGYTKSQVPFAPEAIPSTAPYPVGDDDWIPDSDVPLKFTFSFQGKSYDRVNVSPNGFLLFGALPDVADLTTIAEAGKIASIQNPNNIIALAWADWQPNLVPDPIRWGTSGTAPNRKFVLQYTNVPEWDGTSQPGAISISAGRMTAQVVLSEGSNDITIYINRVATNAHLITQGIEDAAGAVANYDSVVIFGVVRPRVRQFLRLSKDAVRFSLIPTTDNIKPTFTAPLPGTDSVDNDPGQNYATFVAQPPAATDNCGTATVTGTRSDGKPMDAPYPVGITTITWTAKDNSENAQTTTETVHVYDHEAPVWKTDEIASVWTRDATSPLGAAVSFDNMPVQDNVGVTSRSCEPPSGTVFPIGTTPGVTCTAWDAAGNHASITVSVVVVNAHDQIGNLIDWVESRGFPDGTVQPLVNQLRAAFDMTAGETSGCKKMYDFMSMVQKKNSNISSGDAAYMLNAASRILAVMNCAPARNAQVLSQVLRGTSIGPTR